MDKKKVMFVEPRGAYSNVFAKAMTIPLLGPVYLATIAKQAGYPVCVINENILGRKITQNELKSADILCISCITTTIKRGKEIAKQYKTLRPDGKVVIGGIHASMAPYDVVNDFVQVVIGEGEDIILDILSGKVKDKIVQTPLIKNLDNVPLPDFRLIKEWRKIGTWPVMTSRGCPYNCNFCSVTEMFGRGYRTQSPSKVIEDLLRYKRGKIFFADDHFAANQKRTNDLLDLMIEHGIDLTWSAQVRTEVTKNPKLVAKMKKAGCYRVYVGFESINPKSLIDMNKGHKVEDVKRSIRVFQDNGIGVHGMFILGSDSDTKYTFKETSNFCRDTNLNYAQYLILTPLPGTEFYRKLERENRLLHKNWQFYDGLHAVFKPKNMSASELQEGMIDCFKDFYSYTNAINDALNAVTTSALVLARGLYKKIHFPSFKPSLTKLAGKWIINDWVKHNWRYLRYVRNLSNIKSIHQPI